MAGEGLYERYKDALKRGHVAALKGRLDEALDSYAEASRIAPERATPHTAAGTALLRRKRPSDALAYFEAASKLAPRDEAALLGRAQSLVALDRRLEAAEVYDTLAELRAGSGKLADAVDAARRSLELAEGRERRRTLERLISRLRSTRTDEPARAAMERALRVLEGPKVASAPRPKPIDDDVLAAAIAAADVAAAKEERSSISAADWPEAEGLGAVTKAASDAVEGASAAEVADAVDTVGELEELELAEEVTEAEELEAADAPDEQLVAVDPGLEAVLAGLDDESEEPVAEPAAFAPIVPGILERALPPGMEVGQLARLAEDALDAGDADLAINRLLDVAAANRLYGTQDAAIDACYQGLLLRPDDVELHLALVQLYDEHGWRTLATEKLALLERLVDLDEDPAARTRVDAARAARA